MGLSSSQVAQVRTVIGDMMGDIVAVETYGGESAYGPLYAAAQDVTCNIGTTLQAGIRLMRNAAGEEVVLQLTFQVAPADETKFTPGSRVTVSGRTATVVDVTRNTYKGQVAFVEVGCS